MKKLVVAGLASTMIALSGCANNSTKEREEAVNSVTADALAKQNQQALPKKTPNVFIVDKAWIPVVKRFIPKEASWRAGNEPVNLREVFDNFADFAGYVSSKYKVKVELAAEVIEADMSLATMSNTSTTSTSNLSSSLSENLYKISVFHKGDLRGLLNSVTGQKGLYWKVLEDDTVRIYRYDSKTWRIASLLGNLTQQDSVSNGDSTSKVNVDGISVWRSIENGVKSMLSADGKVVVSEALGTVSVTDTPSVMDKVGQYIELQNEALAQNILLDLQVYKVTMTDSDDYGLDWNFIYQSLSSSDAGISASLLNNTALPSEASNISLGIIGSNSELNGTTALIKALSKRGKVSTLTSKRAITLNGQPAPFRVGKSKGYLESSQVTISGGIASTSSTQGIINYGLFINVQPHILNNQKELLLHLSMDLSSLDSLEKAVSGDSTIQTPEISENQMLQRVRMTSGESLVITGFDSSELRSAFSGIGKPDNSWFGGGENSSEERSMLVMVVRPVIGD